MNDLPADWGARLALAETEMDAAGLRRQLRPLACGDGRTARLDGREVLVAAGNGYLGLGHHPEVIEAAREATARWGASSQSSRYLVGDHPLHAELEAACAAFVGLPRALVVGSGFLANVGWLRVLGRDAGVASDALNHASLVEGCRGARAAFVHPYAHAEVPSASAALAAVRREGRPTLLVTESVFSVDGDLAPLAELGDLARAAGALLVVDEAHGLGVAGPTGRGGLEQVGRTGGADLVVGTFGKALGSYGAFLACGEALHRHLAPRLRTAIYSTALPPGVLAAANAALAILRRDPAPVLRLQARARRLRELLREAGFTPGGEPWSPIVPVGVGENAAAVAAAAGLLEDGILAPALRPPTVPEGTARIRFSVSALHTEEDLVRIAAAAARRLPRR